MNQYSYSKPHQEFQSQPKKGGISALTVVLIICGIFSVLVISAIGGLIWLFTSMAVDSDTLKTVDGNDNLSQIEIPSNWMEISDHDRNPEASIQYGNMFAETYAMVLSESKVEVQEAFGEFTIDDYCDLLLEDLEKQGFDIGPRKQADINGIPALRVRAAGKIDGIPIVFLISFIDGPRHFHQLHAWTLTDRENKNMPKLQKISDSFREK